MNGQRWTDYLYERHPPARLHTWARELAYFRFCRAYGGHANDGDQLLAGLRVETRDDLVRTLSTLGVPVTWLDPDTPRPVPGVAYAAAEFARFPAAMPRFPGIGQPGHVEIAGQRAHVWSHGDRLDLSVADTVDPYNVSDAAVASAKAIEALLAPIAGQVVDPPQDDRNCVCPRYYPDLWSDRRG
ncbi:hypothetical protein [Nonomuraea angiospora]|uniref:hypothetical protein n=1 Tax=Nonomuraea angiospora TaxID=46172 RepID=UPI0029B55A45|nr:hypothetical protein [Nonomuraea angiospora]MDX3102087.1 hypothetical protein [Nonomuraea angiospora]